jgi:hypothetical protein
MKNKFLKSVLNSTLALAFFTGLLFFLGYAYDVSHLGRLHLTQSEYLPSSYLEIARPFDLVFYRLGAAHRLWKILAAVAALVALGGILSVAWPLFQRSLQRITTFLGRIQPGFYILTATIGYIALVNWLIAYGWTTGQSEIDMIPDYPDWTITLNDGQTIPCRHVTASDHCYVVIFRDGSNTMIRTIPRDSVSKIECNQNSY